LKKSTQKPEVCRVAIAVLNYLRDHPQAKDSAKGIAEWWVGEEKKIVEKALALLKQEGIIAKRRHLYQLAPNKTTLQDQRWIEKTIQQLQQRE